MLLLTRVALCACTALQIDDGTCLFAGCLQHDAPNFDSKASLPGACDALPRTGCTDLLAFNYASSASVEDGTCRYAGCKDPSRPNFDSRADYDDGSFCVARHPGCTDKTALNYYSGYNEDDGSCTLPGCQDPTRTGYNSKATFSWPGACGGIRKDYLCARPGLPGDSCRMRGPSFGMDPTESELPYCVEYAAGVTCQPNDMPDYPCQGPPCPKIEAPPPPLQRSTRSNPTRMARSQLRRVAA